MKKEQEGKEDKGEESKKKKKKKKMVFLNLEKAKKYEASQAVSQSPSKRKRRAII